MTDVRVSKFLSLVLRHRPETIGETLDPEGWMEIATLLAACARTRGAPRIDRETLERVVRENPKQRFEISGDGARVRAVQGHSVPVDLALAPTPAPRPLYHGTHRAALASIFAEGLKPCGRLHVHLSADAAAARVVGARRGPPAVLRVDTEALEAEGRRFHRARNGVWLTDHVPPAHLAVLTAAGAG